MNNRVIKFRAWDKLKKKMLVPDFINKEGKACLPNDNWSNEIMQFTGLHDKNGKEIYEGDIILNTYRGRNQKQEIYWKSSEVSKGYDNAPDLKGFQSTIGKWAYRKLSNEKGMTLALYSGKYEVIGNIHQHPQLISKDERKKGN